jgi:hypothetical protein
LNHFHLLKMTFSLEQMQKETLEALLFSFLH